MKRKFLSGLLIGAFVFGVGATSLQPVDAASLDKSKERFGQMRDSSNRPTPQ